MHFTRRHWIVDGNKNNANIAVDQCIMDGSTKHDQLLESKFNSLDIGVQCCDENGDGSRPDCQQGKTYDEAYAICKAQGLRLCTREETSNGVGALTGCNFDGTLVWTSTVCEKDEDNLDCTALDIDKFLTDCSTDFETSELQISSLKIGEMILKNEIDSVQQKLAYIDSSLPQQHWTVDGRLEKGGSQPGIPECKLDTLSNSNQDVGRGTGIGYVCCDESGTGNRDGCARGGAYTYAEAVDKCNAVNKTLCTREQVESGAGAGTGCRFDGTQVWTSTRCYDFALNDEISTLRAEIELLKDRISSLEGSESSQPAAAKIGFFNALQEPSSSSLISLADQNSFIFGLVLLNIGLIIGSFCCIACLCIRMRSNKHVSVYDDVQQSDDEESK